MTEHLHPINVAARKAGMSPHLVRMWERRYKAVEPARTSSGRRLYSEADIERLILLHRATAEGQSIGRIAHLSSEELRDLVQPENVPVAASVGERERVIAPEHLQLCLAAMKNLDAVELERRLLRASAELGQQAFVEELLHPLLELTGEMWADGQLRVAHEHLASTVVRSLLGSMYLAGASITAAPLLIGCTPRGQRHEFGALMVLVTAASLGWRTLYLGSDLPAEDIAEAAAKRNADAIALSVVYPSDDPELVSELRRLQQLNSRAAALLVGGRSAAAYGQVLEEIGAIQVEGLVDLRRKLNRLKQITVRST